MCIFKLVHLILCVKCFKTRPLISCFGRNWSTDKDDKNLCLLRCQHSSEKHRGNQKILSFSVLILQAQCTTLDNSLNLFPHLIELVYCLRCSLKPFLLSILQAYSQKKSYTPFNQEEDHFHGKTKKLQVSVNDSSNFKISHP